MSPARRTGAGLWGVAQGAIARLWSFWKLPVGVPRRLVAALAIWPLLLFSFFLIPEAVYGKRAPAVRGH
jgi:hypothetical protein